MMRRLRHAAPPARSRRRRWSARRREAPARCARRSPSRGGGFRPMKDGMMNTSDRYGFGDVKNIWYPQNVAKSLQTSVVFSISEKCHENSMKRHQNEKTLCCRKICLVKNPVWISKQILNDFYCESWGLSGAEVCKYCRSRPELPNECLLAKISFATAENEPLKAWRCFNSFIRSPH